MITRHRAALFAALVAAATFVLLMAGELDHQAGWVL